MDVSVTVFFPAHPIDAVTRSTARIYKVRRRASWAHRLTGGVFWACSTIRIQFVINTEDGGRQNKELSHDGTVTSRDGMGFANDQGSKSEANRRDKRGNGDGVLNPSVLNHNAVRLRVNNVCPHIHGNAILLEPCPQFGVFVGVGDDIGVGRTLHFRTIPCEVFVVRLRCLEHTV